MKIKTLALTAVLTVSSLAYADDETMKPETADKAKPAKLTDAELNVLAHQHQVNMMEVEMGKYEIKNGSAKAVKDYAKTVVADHEKANREIAAFAKKRAVKIPKEMPATDAEKQAHDEDMSSMAKMKKMKGAELDRAFLAIMITNHDRELANLDGVIGQVQDPALKQMLEATRPVLQRHTEKARQLQEAANQTSSLDKDVKNADQPKE